MDVKIQIMRVNWIFFFFYQLLNQKKEKNNSRNIQHSDKLYSLPKDILSWVIYNNSNNSYKNSNTVLTSF